MGKSSIPIPLFSQLINFSISNKNRTKTRASVVFVTGNAGKARELSLSLSGRCETEVRNTAIDLPELQGHPHQIATEKAKKAAQIIRDQTVMTEDTSLEFAALGGMPGPYVKWFLESAKCEGLVGMLEGFAEKRATAVCILALCDGPESEVVLLEGRCEGRIVAPRGEKKFGWDPIFEPDEGGGKTFAEMSVEEKNKISHRAKAVDKLVEYLNSSAKRKKV